MKQTAVPQVATTAVAVAQQGGTALANIIPINGMEDISRLGVAVAKSGWFGNIGQSTGEMIAMTMLQERISPVTFKKKYHVMSDGSITTAARARVSAFVRLGGDIEIKEWNENVCDLVFRYRKKVLPRRVELQRYIDNGIAVSSKTGRLKDNWARTPEDMLWARCCSSSIPKICPEVDDGLYTPEEVADFGNEQEEQVPREPVKIDKSEVVSRLAREAQAAQATQPAPSAPTQPAVAEVVESVAIEMPKPTPREKVAATPMDEAKANLAAVRAAKDAPPAPDNPFVSAPPIPLDAATCPIEGKFFNVPFADMEPDILMFVLMPDTAVRHPELTPAHIEAAKAAARAKGMEV